MGQLQVNIYTIKDTFSMSFTSELLVVLIIVENQELLRPDCKYIIF